MAGRSKSGAKNPNKFTRNGRGQKVYEAPAQWVEILRSAVEDPGVISKAYSLFHSYSVGNQMLALWQLTSRGIELGPLASYGRWQALGRQVRGGEHAILMQQPRSFRKRSTDEATGEESVQEIRYFVYTPTAFAFAQTDPMEGVEDRSAEATTQAPDWSRDQALDSLNVKLVPFTDMDGNTQGYSHPTLRTVALNPVASHPERTLVHELAHVLLGHAYGADMHRGLIEFEAECVALIVSTVLGYGGADESRGYCQTWLHRAGYHEAEDITEKVAGRIFSTATKILNAGRPQKEVRAEEEVQEEVAA